MARSRSRNRALKTALANRYTVGPQQLATGYNSYGSTGPQQYASEGSTGPQQSTTGYTAHPYARYNNYGSADQSTTGGGMQAAIASAFKPYIAPNYGGGDERPYTGSLPQWGGTPTQVGSTGPQMPTYPNYGYGGNAVPVPSGGSTTYGGYGGTPTQPTYSGGMQPSVESAMKASFRDMPFKGY